MNIRKVTKADLKQLVELCSLHAEYEATDYSSKGKQQKLAKALFADIPALYCWVVDDGESLLGYLSATKEYSTWGGTYFIHMDCLYLKDAARGSGIGTKLIQTLKVFAQQQNCNLIQWQTPVENELGIKFYDNLDTSWKLKRRYYLVT